VIWVRVQGRTTVERDLVTDRHSISVLVVKVVNPLPSFQNLVFGDVKVHQGKYSPLFAVKTSLSAQDGGTNVSMNSIRPQSKVSKR